MEVTNRKSVSSALNIFQPLAGENAFIEVTEWTNGEGWDIVIDNKQFSLHIDELAAINFLTQFLTYEDKLNSK